MLTTIDLLLQAPAGNTQDRLYDDMMAQAEGCPYSVSFDGPWPFEVEIGAHCVQEARGTAKAFAREHPETEGWSIHSASSCRRLERCDLLPPSDDDRILQALGWPNASEH